MCVIFFVSMWSESGNDYLKCIKQYKNITNNNKMIKYQEWDNKNNVNLILPALKSYK